MSIAQIAATLGRSVSYVWRLTKVFGLQPTGRQGRTAIYDFDAFKAQYDAGAYYV